MRLNRETARAAVVPVFACWLALAIGCGGGSPLGPVGGGGMLQTGARPLAFQTAAFARGFEQGAILQWRETMRLVQADATSLLATARDKGLNLSVVFRTAGFGGIELQADNYTTYEVDLVLARKKGNPIRATATTGQPEQFLADVQKMAKASGLPADQVQAGHSALYAMINMLVTLNVSYSEMAKLAFTRIVIAEKLKAGERQIDYFDPNRPIEESLADVDLSLRVVAEFNRTVQRSRAEVMVATALIAQYRQPGALEELDALCGEAIARASRIPEAPTAEQFGVVARQLPSPQDLLDELMGDLGFAAAVLDAAKAVVTGDPRGFIDAAAELVPKDTKVGEAIGTLKAAAHGDVTGVIEGVAALTGNAEIVEDVRGRLSKFEHLAPLAEGALGKLR
ncbi:MAG: hypothetical protein JRF63_00610 [Deltaproteobacteria bacterium]|nr:hypothetical protein [Deltaproteobacteria bacterium]